MRALLPCRRAGERVEAFEPARARVCCEPDKGDPRAAESSKMDWIVRDLARGPVLVGIGFALDGASNDWPGGGGAIGEGGEGSVGLSAAAETTVVGGPSSGTVCEGCWPEGNTGGGADTPMSVWDGLLAEVSVFRRLVGEERTRERGEHHPSETAEQQRLTLTS